MLCMLWQGYPVNIRDFKVLLDKRVYHNLEGQWRDLFSRLKWDTVKSALKSVAGLQGRKFKVPLRPLKAPSLRQALSVTRLPARQTWLMPGAPLDLVSSLPLLPPACFICVVWLISAAC